LALPDDEVVAVDVVVAVGGKVAGQFSVNGTLGGNGVIQGDVVLNPAANLLPGRSPGTLTIAGDLTLLNQAAATFELHGGNTAPGGVLNDLVVVGGDLALNGVLNILETPMDSFRTARPGDSWRLFNYSGALTGKGLSLGSLPSLANGNWKFAIVTNTPGQVSISVVPEPSAVVIVTWIAAAVTIGPSGIRARSKQNGGQEGSVENPKRRRIMTS
jgi:fibronectin-binding autotransporter adhesin